MTKEQAKAYVKAALPEHLRKIGIDIHKPFKCMSGTHPDNHPSMSYDAKRQKAHCFSCGADYDTFDLISLKYNITDVREVFKKAYEIFGLSVGESENVKEQERNKSFILQAQSKSELVFEYLENRGVSKETAVRFGVGYCENWKHPKLVGNPKIPTSPRLIIPNDNGGYLARDIRDKKDIPQNSISYTKQKVAPGGLFNSAALYRDSAVFIVEGEIDAMSVEEVGFNAVALGSAANVGKLIEIIKK
jgi:DNA primase